MLQLKKIRKEYKTGDLVQTALNDVSLNLRDSEFVAILGPSGSGKTTLLNIIGGLDRYDSGDLVINGISTKKYTDRDWDSYRNHTIGFVFQSYNLIPHQTVLANVELALTISGVSKEVRRKKAIAALDKVGLGKQLHKRPSQMSGGQMQRVAIARALVNDPEILQISGVGVHVRPELVDNRIHYAVVTEQFHLFAGSVVHPEGSFYVLFDGETGLGRHRRLVENLRLLCDAIHPVAADVLVLVRILPCGPR